MVNTDKFILDTFLLLTNKTFPYGTEDFIMESKKTKDLFPIGMQCDAYGNYYYKIGQSKSIFCSHLDTVSNEVKKVNHMISEDIIKTDGKSILGADDKAGVTIMLYMMKNNVPGLYYFFIGEETGCIGSGSVYKNQKEFLKDYDKIISFDRRGLNSVITYQSSYRCCSNEFADSLCDELNKFGFNYVKDDTGVYTDSAEFTGIIPECTNISVGYFKEHTFNEYQNIKHLIKLAEACININWDKLVIKRDPSKYEYKTWEYDSYDSYLDPDYYHKYDTSNYISTKYSNKFLNEENDDDEWWRKNKRRSNSYFDNGDGKLIPINNSTKKFNKELYDKNYYESVIDKLTGKTTKYELEMIKDQYLDMTEANDILLYEYLSMEITD